MCYIDKFVAILRGKFDFHTFLNMCNTKQTEANVIAHMFKNANGDVKEVC